MNRSSHSVAVWPSDSVMMLGSIEHLQHYFTKAGLAKKSACRVILTVSLPLTAEAVTSFRIRANSSLPLDEYGVGTCAGV